MPDRLSPVLRQPIARWCALALIFGSVALLSLAFSRFAGRVAAIWPANAILLAYSLQRGRNVVSTIASGWVGNVFANVVTGDPLSRALVLSAINSLEIGLCYMVMTRGTHRRIDLTQPNQLAYFVVGAGMMTPAVSAGLAATFLALRGEAAFGAAWKGWWLSDALGLVIFTPAVLVLLEGVATQVRSAIDIRKGSVYLAVLLAVLGLVFLQDRLPILYLVPATLALITFQMGLYGGALGLLLTAVFSNVALIAGLGPTALVSASPEARVVNLQFFLAFLALTTLPLASVLGVRRRFEGQIAAQRDRAEATAKALARTNAVANLAEQMAGVGYWVEEKPSGPRNWSEEMYRIYGLEVGGPQPTRDEELNFYHPQDRDAVRRRLDPREVSELTSSGTYRLNSDGAARRVTISSRMLVHEDGSSVRLGVLVDVTRLYRAEEDLAESVTRYDRLASLIPDLIISHDARFRITYASSAAEALGYTPQELVGRSLAEFIHPDDLSDAIARARDNTAEGPIDLSIRREQRVRTKTGGWVWLEGRPAQIPNADGAAEVLVALRDVSRRRELEDALDEARAQAERALTIKSEFLANMSHELRTPLTAIVGFSGLLRGVGRLEAREARFAERIETASTTLLSLVDDVLDLSKLESGGFTFNREVFAVDALVAEVRDLISTQAQAKELALNVDVEPFLMNGDHARIRQILVNLLGNAVKFTAVGEVRLTARLHGERVSFMVSDTGPGIPAEAQTRIFERFTQVDGASTRAFGGTGLGLAISQALALAMGGGLSVRSRPGEGACFELSLPQAVAGVDR